MSNGNGPPVQAGGPPPGNPVALEAACVQLSSGADWGVAVIAGRQVVFSGSVTEMVILAGKMMAMAHAATLKEASGSTISPASEMPPPPRIVPG